MGSRRPYCRLVEPEKFADPACAHEWGAAELPPPDAKGPTIDECLRCGMRRILPPLDDEADSPDQG